MNFPQLPEGTTFAQYQELLAAVHRKILVFAREHEVEAEHDIRELVALLWADDARVARALFTENELAAWWVKDWADKLEAQLKEIDPETGKPRGRLVHDERGWPIWLPGK